MSHPYSRIGRVGNIAGGLTLRVEGGGGVLMGRLGYVPCFRDFDVCSICMGGGCGGVGGFKYVTEISQC